MKYFLIVSSLLYEVSSLNKACADKGCFVDSRRRTLEKAHIWNQHMTIENCISHCASKNFTFAGLQYTFHCFCGDTLPRKKSKVTDCNMKCAGNKDQMCGGRWRNNVYEVKPRFVYDFITKIRIIFCPAPVVLHLQVK